MENKTIYDLSFVGAGISTSFTLISFLENLEKKPQKTTLKIAIIEKYPEYFTGIPYGERSGFSALLITSLSDFLPKPELGKFITWLNKNKLWLLDEYKKDGGTLSQDWLEHHKKEIDNNQWENLFIPRRFFGLYLQEKVKSKIEQLKKKGSITVTFVRDNINNITKKGSDLNIIGDSYITNSKKVILAIGSPPPRHIWSEKIEKTAPKKLKLFSNPYAKGIDVTLNEIDEFLSEQTKKINVLIVGANASALEMLYKLNDNPKRASGINKSFFISTLGLVPDSQIDIEWKEKFKPKNLDGLSNNNELTTDEIVKAAFADLDVAEKMNIGAATTVGVISKAFGKLLSKLNRIELENFACYAGNEIGRRQRCAGQHYSNNIERLKKEERFTHIAGRFLSIERQENDEFKCNYLNSATGKEELQTDTVQMVINCIGSELLNSKKITLLYNNLIDSGVCKANKSMRGFVVDDNLEATENLHIIGPLLAGNIVDNKPVWHVEHCGRIIWLSKLLADKLSANLVPTVTK